MIRQTLRTITATDWAAIIAVVAVLFLVGYCSHQASQRAKAERAAAESRATAAGAEARNRAAADASAIRDRADARDQSIDDLTRSNRDAILSSPGADMRLDPGLDAAVRRALCLRQSASSDPQCAALLNADSDAVARAR